ncbi:glycosyltransferase [Colwelliaceae bacterium 6441]
MKRILMVALDFPPCKSAGVQRTLKFAEYLLDFGWEPIILTVEESAHESIDRSQVVPDKLKHVYRSFSYNASRDFSIRGKYLGVMKEPDRWWSWRFTAVPLGKELIEKYKPDVIWSTYPVSTAHNIAYHLSKHSGLPWIADYRDPVQSRYDESVKHVLNLTQRIEAKVINNASKVVFTTERASTLYQSLYPDLPLNKFHVIENGYDEGNFQLDEVKSGSEDKTNKLTLLHSGAVYVNGRDPDEIFKAISSLKQSGELTNDNFELVFRGIDGAGYQQRVSELGIVDLIQFKPSISYMESLKEMMAADALLVIQGPLFRNQIPGKLFEYIRSTLPILALTSKTGATADLLQDVGMAYSGEFSNELVDAIQSIQKLENVTRTGYEKYSRYEKTSQLAALLDGLND